jgi:YhcG PDDEXK nuclease domain
MVTEDNPPVGVILCSGKDQTKVQFATAGLDNQLFVSRYLVGMPSADALRKFVESDREAIESSVR